MNKTLIALAVASACVATAAQADTSNVAVYGQMNASMDFVNTNASGQDRLNKVSSNSSRIGFKGSEDMGNGLAANFQIEEQIGVDGSAAWGATQRNTYVGLSGKSWGEVRFGTHDTPYKLGTASLDIFTDTAGDYNTIIGNANGSNVRDLRLGNVAAYISPTINGFHAAIATSMLNESGNGTLNNPSAWTATAIYANGPIFASLSYEKQDYANVAAVTGVTGAGCTLSTTTGLVTCTTAPVTAVAAADAYSTKGTKLGLGYTIDAAKIGFIYERLTDSRSSKEGTRNAYGINVAYTMGANVLKAAYLKANDGDDSTTDTSAKNFTIGVDHNMSKRTAMYALYTKTTNASGATYHVGGGQGGDYTPAAGEDPSMVSIGLKHSF